MLDYLETKLNILYLCIYDNFLTIYMCPKKQPNIFLLVALPPHKCEVVDKVLVSSQYLLELL